MKVWGLGLWVLGLADCYTLNPKAETIKDAVDVESSQLLSPTLDEALETLNRKP